MESSSHKKTIALVLILTLLVLVAVGVTIFSDKESVIDSPPVISDDVREQVRADLARPALDSDEINKQSIRRDLEASSTGELSEAEKAKIRAELGQ